MTADDGAHKHQGLPMDVMLQIAWGTDPETLIRCAATCKELRRHIFTSSSSSSRGRRLHLRLGERLVLPSLLGGQLVGKCGEDLYVEDKARNLIPTGCLFPHEKGRCVPVPVTARGGLVLVRLIHDNHPPTLRVCNPATGRAQSLPPGPDFKGLFVLLVGGNGRGGAVGQPFNVLNVASVSAGLQMCKPIRRYQLQMFSSERGTWGRPIWIKPPPNLINCPCSLPPLPGRHLVTRSGAVHWLCRNGHRDRYYVFQFDFNAGLGSKILPESFHRECKLCLPRPQQMLLAAEADGSPVVLLADDDHGRISAWTVADHTARWKDQPPHEWWFWPYSSDRRTVPERTACWREQPRVVVEYEDIRRFGNVQGRSLGMVRLEWFAERSGIVQISTQRCGFFWLDLQSRKIIRHFAGSLYTRTCPYETMSSWVPTLGTCL